MIGPPWLQASISQKAWTSMMPPYGVFGQRHDDTANSLTFALE